MSPCGEVHRGNGATPTEEAKVQANFPSFQGASSRMGFVALFWYCPGREMSCSHQDLQNQSGVGGGDVPLILHDLDETPDGGFRRARWEKNQ